MLNLTFSVVRSRRSGSVDSKHGIGYFDFSSSDTREIDRGFEMMHGMGEMVFLSLY